MFAVAAMAVLINMCSSTSFVISPDALPVIYPNVVRSPAESFELTALSGALAVILLLAAVSVPTPDIAPAALAWSAGELAAILVAANRLVTVIVDAGDIDAAADRAAAPTRVVSAAATNCPSLDSADAPDVLRFAADDIEPLAVAADAPLVEREPSAVIDPDAEADISSNASRSAADAFDPTDCRSAAPVVDRRAAID